jgi:hypothetical protein
MDSIILIVVSCFYTIANYLILNIINQNVNEPYMDEIFHIPQAQIYCTGNYSHVNNILYIILKNNFYYI